jgi:hypothetical protein
MRIGGIVDMYVEVAGQDDVVAVNGECLENRRQFSEELVADWLAARTVDDDEHELRIGRRQNRRDELESDGRKVKLQSFGFQIVR